MKRTPLKPRRTRKHTIKPERVVDPERLQRLHDFPCVICWLRGEVQESPTEAHHMKHLPDGTILKMGQKAGDDMTLPLCQKKHHWNSVHVAMALKVFEARYGTEPELLAIVNAWLAQDVWTINHEAEPAFVALAEACGYQSIKIGGTAA